MIVLLIACSEAPLEEPVPGLQAALGGTADERYLRAEAPREFSFPEDHGLHPGFRNEWWYFTGNLEDQNGRRFGYQLTFFYLLLPPTAVTEVATSEVAATEITVTETAAPEESSAWKTDRVWMAHLALTDVDGKQHHAFERFSRDNPGLAGAETQPFKVWLEDWQVTSADNAADFPWTLQARQDGVELQLQLQADKTPVLQGDKGLSRKNATAGAASYYYSITRMNTAGEIRLGDQTFSVTGSSWLDREWSTSALAADQSGWDWFSLQFDDGQELMYYQLRDTAGKAHPFSAGNLTDSAGQQTAISIDEMQLEELQHWTSPTGVRYTTAWLLHYNNQAWRVEAVLQEQWMNLSLPYWEGAVDILDADTNTPTGRGYLEMVRE